MITMLTGDRGSLPAVEEEETSQQLGVVPHLQAAADGCGWLCLWLDADREGENICYLA